MVLNRHGILSEDNAQKATVSQTFEVSVGEWVLRTIKKNNNIQSCYTITISIQWGETMKV